MITITDKAIEKLKEFSEAEGLPTIIRIKVQGGGCGGFQNDMFFDDFIDEMDEVFEIKDIKIIIDPLSFQYLENVEIDYSEGSYSSGFKFNNPDVKNTCGCGSSFSM